MKSTGQVRKVDELGRIVLPKDIREAIDVKTGDSMEIYLDEKMVCLKKHLPSCIFCGNTEELVEFKGSLVCSNCRNELTK